MRAAVHDVMRFWLNKKVDGFRMDVINLISKAPGLPDAPVVLPGREFQPAYELFANGPRLHEFLKDMRREVLAGYDVMVVGEMPWVEEKKEVLKTVGTARGELDMIFQFDMYASAGEIQGIGADGEYAVLGWTLGPMGGFRSRRISGL